MIYFFDSDKKYIGSRHLKDGELIPSNATAIAPILTDGQQAHFINGAWAVSEIPAEPVVEVVAEPSLQEQFDALVATLVNKGVVF